MLFALLPKYGLAATFTLTAALLSVFALVLITGDGEFDRRGILLTVALVFAAIWAWYGAGYFAGVWI